MQETVERASAQGGESPSNCGTILVHVEPGTASSHRVKVAAGLARDFDARLVGLGAETFDASPYSGPFTGYAAGEWVNLVQTEIGKNLAAAEAAFRRDAAGADIDWRTMQDYPHQALIKLAHCADLIVASPRGERGPQQAADPADVVMSAGRPVLVVPPHRLQLLGKTVVIAWKNTRECRQSLTGALPFLWRAEDVIVLSVVRPGDVETATIEAEEVVVNLRRRGVEARSLVNSIDNAAIEDEIDRVAEANGADLIVSGAFGHSRLRQWAFGGVTDSFLREPRRFVLLSH